MKIVNAKILDDIYEKSNHSIKYKLDKNEKSTILRLSSAASNMRVTIVSNNDLYTANRYDAYKIEITLYTKTNMFQSGPVIEIEDPQLKTDIHFSDDTDLDMFILLDDKEILNIVLADKRYKVAE